MPFYFDPVAGMFALAGIAMAGTFLLAAIRMRNRTRDHLDRRIEGELERMADSLDALSDQVRGLTNETAELQERVDFAERLLTSHTADEPATPTPH